MALRAISTRSLGEQVFNQLSSEIIGGAYRPGSTLPSERTLSELFGVNRHAVREALKRLQQIGMIAIVPGGGAKVLDYVRTGGLDLLPVLNEYSHEGPGAAKRWRAALEMRAALGADAARLCAIRASTELKCELIAISEEIRHTIAVPEVMATDERFWLRLIDGAENVAYRLAFNSLMRSTMTIADVARRWIVFELEADDCRMPIARAIASGDAQHAAEVTLESLGHAITMLDALDRSGQAPTSIPSPEPFQRHRQRLRESDLPQLD